MSWADSASNGVRSSRTAVSMRIRLSCRRRKSQIALTTFDSRLSRPRYFRSAMLSCDISISRLPRVQHCAEILRSYTVAQVFNRGDLAEIYSAIPVIEDRGDARFEFRTIFGVDDGWQPLLFPFLQHLDQAAGDRPVRPKSSGPHLQIRDEKVSGFEKLLRLISRKLRCDLAGENDPHDPMVRKSAGNG